MPDSRRATPPSQCSARRWWRRSLLYFLLAHQVAFGHDTLWEDLSQGLFGLTNGISFTKYKQDALGLNLSYAGPRGYAVFFWSCIPPFCSSPGIGKVRYLCSTAKTVRAIP